MARRRRRGQLPFLMRVINPVHNGPDNCPLSSIIRMVKIHAISCSIVQMHVISFFLNDMENTMQPMTILIAGPYRSGTEGDLLHIARNLRTLEGAAWQVYAKATCR